ncbi:pyridoxal 5'-phosphate synthase glutaminase subunit PdxT [Terribacillus sp. 7520-G]|uniref:pyridoxal 5'-phosphate synthase glutaminase subunit PdxT n=1 Tax=Terribacillus TaxID=459532 RepID=UPI000BA4F754|nr:pyridoxal 5'-phosphate synthase glutaminase subunit PdxT [Terribacillus sp. 7520-G]PAD37802.1 pyridoxal 5'-phosphate synthase glutaminase subunit PdxT [Terribacillus sp. 7520-G]
MKIGVLALQGAVAEHARTVEAVGAKAVLVKRVEQLADLDGLILPGGESTAMRRLIDRYHFLEPLRAFGASGKPIFGTCAGMILLAKRINNQETSHLGLMDVTVERNAFGRQVDSFETGLEIKGVADDFPAVFIRAPYILEAGPDVEVLSEDAGRIVAARDGHYLATAFHPELTDDTRLIAYFRDMVGEAAKARL